MATESDGSRVSARTVAVGLPCRGRGSGTARIAPGDSVELRMSGGPRVFLPAGAGPGRYQFRLVYDTLDGEIDGPQVSLIVRASDS